MMDINQIHLCSQNRLKARAQPTPHFIFHNFCMLSDVETISFFHEIHLHPIDPQVICKIRCLGGRSPTLTSYFVMTSEYFYERRRVCWRSPLQCLLVSPDAWKWGDISYAQVLEGRGELAKMSSPTNSEGHNTT